MPFASQLRQPVPATPYSPPGLSLDSDRYQIIVKSFRRFNLLVRLIRSIKHYYPDVRVLVADDSFEQLPKSLPWQIREVQQTPGVSWLQYPFDTGLGACRNRMVELSCADYIVNCDDDFVFTAETRLDRMTHILDADASVDILSGAVRERGEANNWLGDFRFHETSGGKRRLEIMPISGNCPLGQWRRSDLVVNFFMARRESLRLAPWDDRLKIVGEHLDHFLTAYHRGLGVAFTNDSLVDHLPSHPTGYSEFRRRVGEFVRPLLNKWRLTDLPNHRSQNVGLPNRAPESSLSRAKPNIVVLGVGHSNTTITTRQIAALGWNLGDADEQFAESISVRSVNEPQPFDETSARHALQNLPQPWVIKDPRFARTLDAWIPALSPYRPLLIWIRKDLAAVKASYLRRGESDEHIEHCFTRCDQHFTAWPWAKLAINAEDVAAGVGMFEGKS